MAEAKHSFVDDYPYLVYSPNAETTSEGGSGGGAGFPVIEADAETGALSVTGAALKTMLETSPVLLQTPGPNWIQLLQYSHSDKYYFVGFGLRNQETPIMLFIFEADSLDDYPTASQG